MKLSNLARLRKLLLNDLSAKRLVSEADHLVLAFNRINEIPGLDPVFANYANDAIQKYRSVTTVAQEPIDQLVTMLEEVDRQISEKTKDYYVRGYMIDGHYASNATDVPTERNDRVLEISNETRELIKNRIALYARWEYPGLEIGPGDGQWTERLVACDPLYIADVHQEFLNSTMSKFTVEYQLRLRAYHIDRWKDDTDLSQLPQNQMGFVFAWNVFNYFPYENLKKYLTQIHSVLRPGGVAMFSYNDSENPSSAEYTELGWMSYMPKTLLITLCGSLGFEVIQTFDADEAISWIEIRKPGILETNKAHQVMGLIKNIG